MNSTHIIMAVATGIGQRAAAANAAENAIAIIGAVLERPFVEIFTACHDRLQNSGGVAMGVAVVDNSSGHMSVASVGNVRTVLLTGTGNTTMTARKASSVVTMVAWRLSQERSLSVMSWPFIPMPWKLIFRCKNW